MELEAGAPAVRPAAAMSVGNTDERPVPTRPNPAAGSHHDRLRLGQRRLHGRPLIIAAGEVAAEIGEVIAGRSPGRRTEGEVTLFKSVGVAAEDVVAADMVYAKRCSHRDAKCER